jgi:hypothetical protein
MAARVRSGWCRDPDFVLVGGMLGMVVIRPLINRLVKMLGLRTLPVKRSVIAAPAVTVNSYAVPSLQDSRAGACPPSTDVPGY